ncbi:MAG: deoxyribose-phosphate aldolase [Kiritimatiellae bacterium]|nr:deoxyribose-phosphate aldolase [Kiritimatiellia bacterium]
MITNNTLRIAIGSDHGGFELKEQLVPYLKTLGHAVQDCGTCSKESVDYPCFAVTVARYIATGTCDVGIIIDGAGIGSAMTANKVKGVLAAACYNEKLAKNSREHNGANVLTLGAGHTNFNAAKKIINVFLNTACTESRRRKRVQMIQDIEQGRFPTSSFPVPNQTKECGVELLASDMQRLTHRVRQLLSQCGVKGSIASAMGLGSHEVAQLIDHTLLKPEAAESDVKDLCDEAIKYRFYSVCVNSSYARYAKNLLRDSTVKLCCVVGFPLGAQPPEIKAAETRKATREGADEIDMVIHVGALKSGKEDVVLEDIRAVVEACNERRALCKVILETALLTDEEKIRACECSMKAGADFVKTSTGFSKGGATVQDIALMSRIVSSKKLGVKASGGIRSYSDVIKMVEAGATRVGASSSIKIIEEAQAIAEGKQYVNEPTSKGAY